jgi:hypothetical protein
MLKDPETEVAKRHRWECGVQRPYKVFVEPLRFFDLETYAGHRRQVFLREVDDKADAKVIQPYESQRISTAAGRADRSVAQLVLLTVL